MKERSNKNRVVTVTFFAGDDEDARHIENEVTELATHAGLDLIFLNTDKVQEHHEEAAIALGIFGD